MVIRIPIVLASDKNYAPQMYITMLSAIKNKDKNTYYDFYCLIPKPFSKNVQKKFYRLKTDKINIKFICMKNEFTDCKVTLNHVATPTYYRLKIAELLPQYEKAIYLDVDTIVLGDLTELYNTDLKDNYIAGVHSATAEMNYKHEKIQDMTKYINAGVVLFNISQIKKDNMTKKLLSLIGENYPLADQDIINVAFNGKIKLVDFKYNIMTYYKDLMNNPETKKRFEEIYGKENFENALKNPVIIHYLSNRKPWAHKDIFLDEHWHKYAMKSKLKCNICNYRYLLKNKFYKQIKNLKSKKVLLWGASLFLTEALKNYSFKYKNILGVIDKNPTRKGQFIESLEIFSPEDIKNLNPDIIIVTIENNINDRILEINEYMNDNGLNNIDVVGVN